MAIQEITYTDKISLVTSPLPDENKVTDTDMNMIKNVVNNNITSKGSNANGTYIKFANGMMICTKTIDLTNITVNTAIGQLYTSSEISLGNFAQTFSANPVCNVSLTTRDYNGFVGEYKRSANLTSSAGSIYIYRPTIPVDSTSYTVNVIAIGTYE